MRKNERGLITKMFDWGSPGPVEAAIKQDEKDRKDPQAALARKQAADRGELDPSIDPDKDNLLNRTAHRRANEAGQGFGGKTVLNGFGAMKGDKL